MDQTSDLSVSFRSQEIKDVLFQENISPEKDLENLSKFDLLQLLKETKNHCITVEESNQKLQDSVDKLEKALDEQNQKCKILENDKSLLRNNIKKASENWFERKKLSESESSEQNSLENVNVEENELGDNQNKKQSKSHLLITNEAVELFSELKYKDEQLELSNRCIAELNKRLKDYEKVIDDHEVIIAGLEKQLDTYFNDNQTMSKQLADLHRLFLELELINEKQVKIPIANEEVDNSNDHLPTVEEFKDMSGSVTKTYMKLRELIYEKKSLVTEIERLQTLNIELQNRVSQQETRLISVSDALQTTWLLVSNLQDKHAQIHTAETILRYELREKREILNRLRNELECSREQWHIIRQKNSETEQEWTNLREELDERRKLRKLAEIEGNQALTADEIEGAVGGSQKTPENEFEPPIDLLVDMGIEYGVINADDEESTTVVALIDGQDVHEHRLQNLEEQCCFLYQKLMSSTSRALTLANRLSSLHEHYATSDDDEDDEDENENYFGEDDGDEEYEEDQVNIYESEMTSPDSESYDTAYVSETEGADSASGVVDTIVNEGDIEFTEISSEGSQEDNINISSRRLITFLPRKIEILRAENKKLEERLQTQQEEKAKIETTLNAAVEVERRQRRQLEQQLSHLGKCVDELKLERNGKIAEVEKELRQKVEQVEKEEKEYTELREEYENLKEKFEQRGELLHITAGQLEETVRESEEKFSSLQKEIVNMKKDFLEKETSNLSRETQSCQTESFSSSAENKNSSECEQGAKSKLECWLNRSNSQGYSKAEQRKSSDPNEQILKNEMEEGYQFKRMIILTDTSLRVPFNLPVDCVLYWSFHVALQEIKFSITYDNLPLFENSLCDIYEADSTTGEFPSRRIPADNTNTAISMSRELLVPHSIASSCSPTTGRIIPKVSGQYSLVFQNHTSESQEIRLKLWLEKSVKEEVVK